MDSELTQAFKEAIGGAAMDAMDRLDDDCIRQVTEFYEAAHHFAKMLESAGFKQAKAVALSANMAAGAAFDAMVAE